MLTWASITSAVLGLVRGIITLFNKSVEWFKEKALIKMGRDLEAAELAKKEIDINREQTEILTQDRSKKDTEKRLEEGTF